MRTHNRVWLLVILLGWAVLFIAAGLTDGFTHTWAPQWAHVQTRQ